MHEAGADQVTAVVEGLSHTGRIVITAAALLAVDFFAFGTSGVTFIGVAILIDAPLVRGGLAPAGMQVLGRAGYTTGSDSARRPAPSRPPTDGGPSTRRLECTDCVGIGTRRLKQMEATGSESPGWAGTAESPARPYAIQMTTSAAQRRRVEG
jgi:hypothetical protein